MAHWELRTSIKSLLPIIHNPLPSNYEVSFCGSCHKVIPVLGWRFAPACCAAQSVIRRGPCCSVPHHRLAQAAQLKHRSGLQQLRAPAKKMKTSILLFSTGVKRIMWCGLTGRSTGPIAAGRHLGDKSLAQIPARRNGPVSYDVRPRTQKASRIFVHPKGDLNAYFPFFSCGRLPLRVG